MARADYPFNLTPGVTSTSRLVFDLHRLSFWICVDMAAAESACDARL
jgi:hypothetical protein